MRPIGKSVPKLKLTGGPKEDELQTGIATLLHAILPKDLAWSHFPAGGYYLTPAARARLYRLGLQRGFPDIFIGLPEGRCLWLEVKSETGRLEKDQVIRHAQLRALDHPVEVVRSVDDVLAVLDLYHVPHKGVTTLRGTYGATQGYQGTAQSRAAQPAQGNRGVGFS